MKSRPRAFRLMLTASGICGVAVISDGWTCHLLGVIVTLLALVAYGVETPKFARLVYMWCGGFLLILAPEGLMDAGNIARVWGQDAFDTASRCIVASHFAVLLGHDLVFDENAVGPSARPWRLEFRSAVAITLTIWLASLLFLLPVAITAFTGGRAETGLPSQSAASVVVDGLVMATRVIAPVTAVWLARRRHGASRQILLAVAAISVGFELIFAVRFVLLFMVLGCLCAWMAPRRLSARTAGALVAAGVALAMASAITKDSRTYGLRTADLDRVVGDASVDYFVMSEASVRSATQAVVYTERRGFTDGRTSAALFVFWIPRAFWPDKPTMIGHWLPREFARTDAGFSSAPGFTGGTYVDFGLWGSVLLWFLGGLVFGGVERVSARVLASPEDARVLLVAPLFGAAFFAVRSPETTGIALSGVMLLAMLVLLVSGRLPPRARVPGYARAGGAVP